MSAVPAENQPPLGPNLCDLPRLSDAVASATRLVTAVEVAVRLGVDPRTVRSHLAKPGAPQPVAATKRIRRGSPDPLYRLAEVTNYLAGTPFGGRVRSQPPRVIGTRTPTAGRPYRWRDPARWRG